MSPSTGSPETSLRMYVGVGSERVVPLSSVTRTPSVRSSFSVSPTVTSPKKASCSSRLRLTDRFDTGKLIVQSDELRPPTTLVVVPVSAHGPPAGRIGSGAVLYTVVDQS